MTVKHSFGATRRTHIVTIPTSDSATLTVATENDHVNEMDGSFTAAISIETRRSTSTNTGTGTVSVTDNDCDALPRSVT